MKIALTQIAKEGFTERVKLHQDYIDSLPETKVYDAATLILVMHFIPDDGAKLLLLQNIAKRLKSGATLILADLHGDRSYDSFQKLFSTWKNFYFNRLGNVSVEDENNFRQAIDSIHFIPESRIFTLLRGAGFNDIIRFYNAFLFGGWTAKLQ